MGRLASAGQEGRGTNGGAGGEDAVGHVDAESDTDEEVCENGLAFAWGKRGRKMNPLRILREGISSVQSEARRGEHAPTPMQYLALLSGSRSAHCLTLWPCWVSEMRLEERNARTLYRKGSFLLHR